MKEFTPSPEFVTNTMAKIHDLESKQRRPRYFTLAAAVLRRAGAAGALLLGIVNLIRLLAAMYAPALCH